MHLHDGRSLQDVVDQRALSGGDVDRATTTPTLRVQDIADETSAKRTYVPSEHALIINALRPSKSLRLYAWIACRIVESLHLLDSASHLQDLSHFHMECPLRRQQVTLGLQPLIAHRLLRLCQ